MHSQATLFHKALKQEAMKKENEPVTITSIYLKTAKHFKFQEMPEEKYNRADVIFLQHYFLNVFQMLAKYERNMYGITGFSMARLLEAAYIEACCQIHKEKFTQSSLFKNQ
jgi:hypothetical protein